MSTTLATPASASAPLPAFALLPDSAAVESAPLSETSPPPAPPLTCLPIDWTAADLQQFLGDIPLNRIRLFPPPGMATEADALAVYDRGGPICELVDGILVEKDMATFESIIAFLLGHWIGTYLDQHPLGVVVGANGPLRILPERMRVPDLSFIGWEKFPDRRLPQDLVFRVVPDLVVEVLSPGNTRKEMEIKRQEYLQAGVRLIWYIDPRKRTATVYRGDGTAQELDATGMLDGGGVLPGFSVSLERLFAEIGPAGPPPQ